MTNVILGDQNAHRKCSQCGVYDECNSAGRCLGCLNQERYWSVFGGWNLIGRGNNYEVVDGTNSVLGAGELREGYIFGGAIGRRLNRLTRTEFELSLRGNSGDTLGAEPLDGNITNFATMWNIYRNLRSYNKVQPYFGGGIGFGFQHGDFFTEADQVVDIRDEALAFQAILGASYEIMEDSNIFFEYRYFGNTETDLRIFGVGDVGEVQYQSQNFLFGFRQRF